MSFSSSLPTPMDVYYVVRSAGVLGERAHCLRSDLFETRPQAETALTSLPEADPGSSYGIWKSTTYVEPAEWLHRVVRSDGTLILPRLRGLEKYTSS